MTAAAIVVVLLLPVAVLVALLSAVNALHARRAERVARQIALTDAIHAALGPVVAPVVRRGRGHWIGVLPVVSGEPHVEVMVDIAHAQLGGDAEIVLVPRALPPPRSGGRRDVVGRPDLASSNGHTSARSHGAVTRLGMRGTA